MEKSDIARIVKGMLDSGLPEQIIIDELKDSLGLKESEIKEAMQEAKSPAVKPKVEASVEPPLKPSTATEPDFTGLQNTTAQNVLDEHGQKIEDLKTSLNELHDKIDSISLSAGGGVSPEIAAKLNALPQRLDALNADIKELKAGTNALVDLLKKILETDRQVLAQLEKKK